MKLELKIAELLLTVGIPSFITVVVFYWQECSQNKLREVEAKKQRDRAFTLVESDMKTINSSIDSLAQTLSNIGNEVVGIRERIAKLEAQIRPD